MKKANKRLVIKDSGLVLDLTTGNSYTLNQTGLAIFKGILDGEERSTILEMVCREFAVDEEVASKDLDEFLLELKVMGIYED
ncbi:MAG: hypothetical protein ACD_28C00123G0002 [uncultured bacterium]|nr:MAG: hypothetical protein ACD_28C00123G0002 [uncultured bacterium]